MSEPGAQQSAGNPPWPVFGLGALAVCCLVALAVARLADPRAAFVCALLLGLCAVALAVRPVRRQPFANIAGPPARAPPFPLMIESLEDPILLVSGSDPEDFGDRRFVYANLAARELLRLQREEGPLTTAMRTPEVLAGVEEALFSGVAARAAWHSRGAQERFWQIGIVPLSSTAPERRGRLALLTFHDETEIRRSESTRADFLANASHELRTPLASLTGFIETLRGHARDDPAAREKFLAIMQVQAERMRHLVEDLMSLSRIELTEHIRPSGQIDLATAVVDVVDALSPQADQNDISFNLSLPPTGTAIAVGDRDQIVQVAQNLIENAIKYTLPEGVVSISVDLEAEVRYPAAPRELGHAQFSLLTPDRALGQRYVALRVRDSGAGIARNHLPRLTERFYRVEGQKARERPGTGLGLAIVKHIVNRHRGGMAVESAPGLGSTFTVYVPMADDSEAPGSPPLIATQFA